jgi:hypothetical protein
MDGEPAAVNVMLELRTVGPLSDGRFSAATPLRSDTLVVINPIPGRTAGDTTAWSIRVRRQTAVPRCDTKELPDPAFCWSGAGDTLRVSGPSGTATLILDHWTVAPAGKTPDSDRKAVARTWIQRCGIGVAIAGAITALIPIVGAIKQRSKPIELDEDAYLKGLVAAMTAARTPEERERRQTIMRWSLLDHVLYEDALERIQFTYKPPRDGDAEVFHSSAVYEFRQVHARIGGSVDDGLEKLSEEIAAFAAKQKVAEEAKKALEPKNAAEPTEPD